ncbi:hypothetical protein A2U01_0107304, partial [Trifolium medium]|nr:hypothetical protein [Trifolium medium]
MSGLMLKHHLKDLLFQPRKLVLLRMEYMVKATDLILNDL